MSDEVALSDIVDVEERLGMTQCSGVLEKLRCGVLR